MNGADGKSETAVERAQQLLRAKRYADALQVCNDALARGTDDPELRLVAAQSLLAQGRHEGAKKEAQQVVRLDPTTAEAHRILAEVAFTRGEHAAAREHLGRVLELDPDDDKSRALLETLQRPSGATPPPQRLGATPAPAPVRPFAAAPGAAAAPAPEVSETARLVKSLSKLGAGARTDESAQIELSADDLEEDDDPHMDPFSEVTFSAKEPSSDSVEVSDSMMEELPAAPTLESMGTPRGLSTLTEIAPPVSSRSVPQGREDGAPPRRAEESDPGLTQPVEKVEKAAVEDAWKPMDAGAGTTKKYEGTLRLPALGDLPEEEDAPTMPLLRPSGPPKPQLRLDPLGAKPVVEEEKKLAPTWRPPGEARLPSPGARTPAPQPGLAFGAASTPAAGRAPAPVGTPFSSPAAATSFAPQPGRDDDSDAFEEFAVEQASAPAPEELAEAQQTRAVPRILVRAAEPSEPSDPGVDGESSEDLLGMLTGRVARDDASMPESPAPTRRHKPTGPERPLGWDKVIPDAPRRKRPSEPARPLGRESGRARVVYEPEPDSQDSIELGSLPPRGPLTPDDLEQQLAAAAAIDPRAEKKKRAGKKGGAGRWVLIAFIGLVVGGGGLFGYLWYRSYKYVQGEWQTVREAIHKSTSEGYRDARAAAERILTHRGTDSKASSAIAMCDAAMSVEFGEDRLKAARDTLEKAKGTDSEWRTAANAFLALTDEPQRAEGYLQKGLEVYPESALLHYLRGRALAASEAPEKAREAYRSALKLVPRYTAARIALAVLEGQQASGYADASRALDEILRAEPDNLQALVERARLRARHGKELTEAAADARRVVGELASRAGRGQIGWAHLVLAQLAAQAKQFPAMGTELDLAIKSPPCCDSSFRHETAGELMKLFRMGDALVQLDAALKLKPKQPEYLQRLARVLLDLDDAAGALAQLQNAPARALETRLLTGRALFAQGSLGKAAETLKGVLAESKDSLEAAVQLAFVRARQGETAEAASTLEKLIAAHPDDPTLPKALGTVQLWARDYGKADATLRALWKVYKQDPAVPTLLGVASLRRHHIDRAQKRFDRALLIRPDYRPARLGLALLLLGMGRTGDARDQVAKIPELDRKRPDVLVLVARLALAEGKLDEARTATGDAEAAGAPAADVARLTGELALARKDKAAEESLRKASKLVRGKDAEVLTLLGRAQLLSGKVDDAYDTFNLALKEDPGNPLALLELGRIAIKDGEHPTAIKRLTEAVARMKERKFPAVKVSWVHTALGQGYLKQKDTGHAISSLQDAIDLDGAAAEPQFWMGETYSKLSHPERAVRFYAKALQLDPSRSEIYELLGRCYTKLNDPKLAAKNFEEYLRTNPPAAKAKAVQRELEKLQGQ